MAEGSAPGLSTKKGNLGTFAGVFTPSILTILGIILFRRLGYVVGGAGLQWALLILLLSSAIAVLTSISLAAIATNLKVGRGGPYYLISRTLGVEFGGAIGTVLFLAQSVSIAFYCIGFAETMVNMFSLHGRLWPMLVAALCVLFLFVFAWLGADWATRLQYLVMAILAAAIVSFFAGAWAFWSQMQLEANWEAPQQGPGFWFLFAIFFPAITGFTQGLSMSGDLKDAGRSIQVGTFTAVGVSILIYFTAAVAFAGALPETVLTKDFAAMKQVSLSAWLIDAGVLAATLSSAMASFLGAPRILQSLAADRIFPFLLRFAEGAGPTANPRRGVILSGCIALATVGLGSLNLIAPIISMFFLISYGLLNYATFFEARASSPSFRPRFRWYDARLSLVGAVGCLGAMIAIDIASSVVAVALLMAIYQYLKRTAGPARWADSRRSYHFFRIREDLLDIDKEPEHPRDWRPCILALCGDNEKLEPVLRFGSWVEGGSGFTTAVKILEGEGYRSLSLREKAEKELRQFIADKGLAAFSRAVVAPNLAVGIGSLVQGFGIGGIHANVVLLHGSAGAGGEAQAAARRESVEIQQIVQQGCNVVLLDWAEGKWELLEKREEEGPPLRIDVWWWGDKTSQLMLLLAYLMTRVSHWEGAVIRVIASASESGRDKTLESLHRTLEEVRIDAEPLVLRDVGAESVAQHSQGSAVVFFPLYYREWQLLGESSGDLDVSKLPVLALTLAAEDIDLEAGPEEGEIADATVALDAVQDLQKDAAAAEKEALRLAEELAAGTGESQAGDDAAEAVKALQEQAEKAASRARDLRARAAAAVEKAKELGVDLPAGKNDK